MVEIEQLIDEFDLLLILQISVSTIYSLLMIFKIIIIV